MLTIDFETRSRVDLKKCGTSVYARHPSTEIMCLAWAMHMDDVKVWKPGDDPKDLIYASYVATRVEAHNAFFERLIWHHICHTRLGWPDVDFEKWRCSLAACSRLALPRSLDGAGVAVGVEIRKDDAGKKIMQRLCKPKKPSKKDPSEWDNDPTKFERLYSYCARDVESERAISEAIRPLTSSELKVWQLDQRINLRGIAVDRIAIENAIEVVEAVGEENNKRIAVLTNDSVKSTNQVKAICDWIEQASGERPDSLAKGSIESLLEREDISPNVRSVLELRLRSAKASVKKLKAMLDRCDDDNRIRGNLVYHGASTGRWAGAGIQIQNFTRGTLSEFETDLVHRMLPASDADLLEMLFGDALESISGSLRSMVVSEPGKRLLVCDFAQIEARVLAWLAGQDDLLADFKANKDVYVAMASRIYETPENEINKSQRFFGKTAVLGLGYGMGAKAFKNWVNVNKVDCELAFAKRVVKIYRDANDKIKSLWRDVGTACIRAIETQQPHRVGRLEMSCDSDWLRITLPSKRQLHYREPHLVEVIAPWSEGHEGDIIADEDAKQQIEDLGVELGDRTTDRWTGCSVPKGVITALRKIAKTDLEKKEPQYIKQIQFYGVASTTRKWGKERTYGAKLVENIVQAVARDFLVEAMFRVERAGYPIVATIHDEIMSERENGEGSLEEFESLMRKIPKWGRGCPIEVEGFESGRYRK
ncbi:MAG: DNA polymerase [Planctomycetota bacterium]